MQNPEVNVTHCEKSSRSNNGIELSMGGSYQLGQGQAVVLIMAVKFPVLEYTLVTHKNCKIYIFYLILNMNKYERWYNIKPFY